MYFSSGTLVSILPPTVVSHCVTVEELTSSTDVSMLQIPTQIKPECVKNRFLSCKTKTVKNTEVQANNSWFAILENFKSMRILIRTNWEFQLLCSQFFTQFKFDGGLSLKLFLKEVVLLCHRRE